jgi:hypothetical protein
MEKDAKGMYNTQQSQYKQGMGKGTTTKEDE